MLVKPLALIAAANNSESDAAAAAPIVTLTVLAAVSAAVAALVSCSVNVYTAALVKLDAVIILPVMLVAPVVALE